MENVVGEQGLLTSNTFHTNPSNFRKIQTDIKTYSATFGGWNLAAFIFLTCSFYFWHLFCTTTVFNDWQGHVTVSCKEPIYWPEYKLYYGVGRRFAVTPTESSKNYIVKTSTDYLEYFLRTLLVLLTCLLDRGLTTRSQLRPGCIPLEVLKCLTLSPKKKGPLKRASNCSTRVGMVVSKYSFSSSFCKF